MVFEKKIIKNTNSPIVAEYIPKTSYFGSKKQFIVTM
jgi:hypothetical protein